MRCRECVCVGGGGGGGGGKGEVGEGGFLKRELLALRSLPVLLL